MDSEYETSINAKGPHITDTEFNRFKARLNSVYTDDIFVLSGNIEEEIKDRMVDLVKELCEEGVKVVLDGEKDFIEHCLDFGLYGIKLNDRNTDGDVVETAKRYLEKGVKSILYSAPHFEHWQSAYLP